jgi:L-amino acid N-acyltransferase YncA
MNNPVGTIISLCPYKIMATIRKAVPADALAIAHVHVDSWRTTYKGLISAEFLANLSYKRREQVWAKTLSDSNADSFIYIAANEAGQIKGFVSAGPERTGETDYHSEVYAIYLLQQSQGQGIGRKLIQAAAKELLERGFLSMLLWVLKDNCPSRRFYEAVGGEYLREKSIEIGGQNLIDVAYGWKDLHVLAGEKG